MNIIELAKKAGIAKYTTGYTCWEGQLERFAALVLEEAAKVCDSLQDVPATEPRHCAEDIRIEARALKGAKK